MAEMSNDDNVAKGPARVLIVDDHPVVRDGLTAELATEPDLEVCGEAEDVAGALEQIRSARPDVAIIDISLKNGNGVDLIKRLRARNDPVRILVWSMYPEDLYAERALRAGAQGYVHKGRATREILDALRAVLAGKASKGRDGVVYLHHLNAHVEDRAKALSGGEQEPTSSIPASLSTVPLSKP